MKYLLSASIIFLLPLSAFAASLDFSKVSDVHANDQFAVTVTINTGTESINAIEGSITIPASLKLDSVQLSGSLVPLWVSAPTETTTGTVTFAGVLPGGFQGTGNLFTLILTAERSGNAEIRFGTDTHAYQNDGAGTAVMLKKDVRALVIGPASATPKLVTTTDTIQPEPFTPEVADGTPFGITGTVLIFGTQDKDSGIDHYEVAVSYSGNASESGLDWHAAESPYTLTAGDGPRYIYVRAVDAAGNTRVAVVPPQTFSPLAIIATWWLAILGLFAVLIVLVRSRFQR